MSDLFQKEVPFEFVDDVMEVIEKTPHHTYQILTKRSGRMKSYFNSRSVPDNAWLGVSVEDKKYGKRSVRVIEGDSIKIVRGEFKGVEGKVAKVSTEKSSVAIEGVKKEKTKGEKFDVYIHTSNLVITSLNTDDKLRVSKLEGKDPRKQPKVTHKETKVEEETQKKFFLLQLCKRAVSFLWFVLIEK